MQCVQQGAWGIDGWTQYIRGFVDYGIAGTLLKEKLERLSKVIDLVIIVQV